MHCNFVNPHGYKLKLHGLIALSFRKNTHNEMLQLCCRVTGLCILLAQLVLHCVCSAKIVGSISTEDTHW